MGNTADMLFGSSAGAGIVKAIGGVTGANIKDLDPAVQQRKAYEAQLRQEQKSRADEQYGLKDAAAKTAMRRILRMKSGEQATYGGTLLTGPLGVTGSASGAPKTLLGY